ncbi:hypothetical protein B0A54_03789 [Friedmanniomyces endolithicus]|uniref:AAA+ ATPase domain-containing protein n=1 Tax=Friedmanniomyces endolithicus TaxID=329885 RepID=A0A4U0VDC4_9PEZI|nr:hypothetical protein LTS09_003051 [Friedmanniomyces endolithicus]TKA46833.1 hypothetical protein B0A54_03789 [Friedmanniomyces endolithicus]
MLRKAAPANSMQKTYDECYLVCSTAIYFEGQNNEAEALRSWRNALDQIYYHNAYKMPSSFVPRTETERALHDSLRAMEMQCKERVDLLDALRKSRIEADEDAKAKANGDGPSRSRESLASVNRPAPPTPTNGSSSRSATWLGGSTVPQTSYADIPRPPPTPERRPAVPKRPSYVSKQSSDNEAPRTMSLQSNTSPNLALPTSSQSRGRTPSPDKKAGGMLKTLRANPKERTSYPNMEPHTQQSFARSEESLETVRPARAPPPPPHREPTQPQSPADDRPRPQTLSQLGTTSLSYMKEYPNHPPAKPRVSSEMAATSADRVPHSSDSDHNTRPAPPKTIRSQSNQTIPRKSVARGSGVIAATAERQKFDNAEGRPSDRERQSPMLQTTRRIHPGISPEPLKKKISRRKADDKLRPSRAMTPPSSAEEEETLDSDHPGTPTEQEVWDNRVKAVMKDLPKGVDEGAAKQIFNEIVIHGDEVHWDDVAGLEIAKSALKETVVYPFLRPDLFMGLREPARGMLLFGPPGTGKTMLARAVATESKSVFFAISASSLTSKYLGESEKLVRALFSLAKALAPSIIFVDEIDSLLGARGGSSEHEATRRIKTEFLIQWSDLQKAAAGREDKGGDATRVLVLAATNLPWAIDEAARRRFVRRQYIPLPEDWVREKQLRTLLAAQNHNLSAADLTELVRLTDGFSGSDITALAKDAAMGPLRSLGERLLHMRPEEIRGIQREDFEASLINIRASVSRQGLKEFEDWAREFGERGG